MRALRHNGTLVGVGKEDPSSLLGHLGGNMADEDLPWIRTSERSCFKRCPQQWWWAYVEKLTPRISTIGAREFGTGIHLCMEAYYPPGKQRGVPLLETWDKWCSEQDKVALPVYNDNDIRQWVELKELGRGILTVYDQVWGGDPNWDVISTEMHFQINVNDKAIDVGTIDLVFREMDTGKIYLVDHKTCTRFPDFSWLNLDDQNGSYSAVAETILRDKKLIGPKETVSGFLYNYLRKGIPDDRPTNESGQALNQNGTVSKRQPTPIVIRHPVPRTTKEKNRQLQRLQDDVVVMNAVRSGTLPILKTPSRDCTWCDFFLLCQVDESKGDVDLFKKRIFKTTDPYADHRTGAQSSKVFIGRRSNG